MVEQYISPVLKVLCFAPVERLAGDNVVDFDDLINVGGGGQEEAHPSDEDINIIL